MSTYKLMLDWDDDEQFFQDDSMSFLIQVRDTVINTWKIRATFYDDLGNYVKLATSDVTGGSDDEILITSEAEDTDGEFIIYIEKDSTNCFGKNCHLEVERELSTGKVKTILKKNIYLNSEKLDWTEK